MAMPLAGILAIQNRRNVRCQTRIKDLLGIRDTGRNAGDNLRVCQFFEGFVFGHAGILAHVLRIGNPVST
jgi:hypothetical protein